MPLEPIRKLGLVEIDPFTGRLEVRDFPGGSQLVKMAQADVQKRRRFLSSKRLVPVERNLKLCFNAVQLVKKFLIGRILHGISMYECKIAERISGSHKYNGGIGKTFDSL